MALALCPAHMRRIPTAGLYDINTAIMSRAHEKNPVPGIKKDKKRLK
jgi:hypothetical protein